MNTVRSLVSVIELKRLLVHLHGSRPDICIRYRMLGEMWGMNFMSVFHVTENGVLLTDDVNHRMIAINDLSGIMQFEIDKPFNGYQPYFHYEVQPLLNFASIERIR